MGHGSVHRTRRGAPPIIGHSCAFDSLRFCILGFFLETCWRPFATGGEPEVVEAVGTGIRIAKVVSCTRYLVVTVYSESEQQEANLLLVPAVSASVLSRLLAAHLVFSQYLHRSFRSQQSRLPLQVQMNCKRKEPIGSVS